MTLPLLTYPLSTQNQRVDGFEIPGDEQPRRYDLDNLPIHVRLQKGAEMDALIRAGYRQVFNEQQIISYYRQPALESQLRSGQITVREFIQGLALSDAFRRLNYEVNNNYRLVEICMQRFLGRPVYHHRETLAWSIVLATQGLNGFIEALLSSEEYLTHFGDTIVPYQRRRILPGRSQGELPLARIARYDHYHLRKLQQLSSWGGAAIDRSASVYRSVIFFVPTVAIALLILALIFVIAPQ